MAPPTPPESPLVFQVEILIPFAIVADRGPGEVERLLSHQGLVPDHATDRRWQLAAERQGYLLSFRVALPTAP